MALTYADIGTRTERFIERNTSRLRGLQGELHRFTSNHSTVAARVTAFIDANGLSAAVEDADLPSRLHRADVDAFKTKFNTQIGVGEFSEAFAAFEKAEPYYGGGRGERWYRFGWVNAAQFDEKAELLDAGIQTRRDTLKTLESTTIPGWQLWRMNERAQRDFDLERTKLDLARYESARELLIPLRVLFDEKREAETQKYAESLVAPTQKALSLMARVDRVQSTIKAAHALQTLCPARNVYHERVEAAIPLADTPVGNGRGCIDWRALRLAHEADSELFVRNLRDDFSQAFKDARKAHEEAMFKNMWGVDEQARRELFRSSVPGMECTVERSPGYFAPGDITVEYEKDGELMLRGRIFWFPDNKMQGIESVWAPKDQRGSGAFKDFMRGVVALGEAQGAETLELLAGQQSGPSVWAKLGAKVGDERLEVKDMVGRVTDTYTNWKGVTAVLRGGIDQGIRAGHIAPDTAERLKAIVGSAGDDLPPKGALREIVTMPDTINGERVVDYMLGHMKYAAVFDYNDPDQMDHLKQKIAPREAGPAIRPSMQVKI